MTDVVAVVEIVTKIIAAAAAAAPSIISAGNNLLPFAKLIIDRIGGKTELTPEEAAEIDVLLEALVARLQRPLPPEQADDI